MPNITVGCKLPNGLHIKVADRVVTLNGANSSRIVGGYGLTTVDKDFYEAWAKEYAAFGQLKDGLIFAQDKPADADAKAKDNAKRKSGLEPLDADKPAPGVKPVAKDD